MNKWIKNKKRFIMNSRKSFTKEENLFAKQFQRLYISCEAVNVNRLTTTRLYKYVLRNKFMTKDEFQLSIRMILFNLCECYQIKDRNRIDRVKYYLDFYNNLGIKFYKENKSVKIEFKGRC